MATLTTKKETAIRRLQDKLTVGKQLLLKVTNELSEIDFTEVVEEIEVWSRSTANTLRQVFSDNHLSDDFLSDEDTIVPVELTHVQKIGELKKELKAKTAKLEHVINDLDNGLYYQGVDINVKVAKIGLWQSIIIAIITAIAGIVTGFIASPSKTDPLDKQGLSKLTLEGKWKYICTSFDGSYQHGGRFKVQKDKDGTLYLVGERMWRDTKDTTTGIWTNKEYLESDYLQWHTNWIFVNKSSQMNFEYEIPTQTANILGYCSGRIYAEKDTVEYVKGNFYVLNENPILTGQIIFKRVTNNDYNSTQTLPKNH
jgi:hypothetical protein